MSCIRTRADRLFFLAVVLALNIGLNGCGNRDSSTSESNSLTGDDKIIIAMMPKLINIDYFDACHTGAQKVADELGVSLIYDGPTEASGSEQSKFIETWIRQGVDAICVAPNQPKSVKRFFQRAQARGIKVLTWDTDAPDSGRDLFVNQIDDQLLGTLLMDEIADRMEQRGEWAIAIGSLDASNLNTWRKFAEARAVQKYPEMKLVDTVVTEENVNVAREKIETLLNVHPELKGIIAFDSNSVPGAAEALKRSGKYDQVALTGNTTPGKMRSYLEEGVLRKFFLWDPRQLGELTVRLAVDLVRGQQVNDGYEVENYGPVAVHDNNVVIMSDPIEFTAENMDQYDWGF